MALRYGYFDSEITGYDIEGMPILDRAESSDLLCLIFAMLLTDGVLAKPNDCFQVIADEGMRLKIKAGFGLIKGHFAFDDEEAGIWISNAPKAYKRIDAVVLRLNRLERLCEIIVKEGIPATNPVAPELERPASGDYYELCLAEVQIKSNQTVITQSNITDTRADSSKCGFIAQLIDSIDTSVFFAQLDAFYQEFVDKSNTNYEEFCIMAQKAYEQYSKEIADYIAQLKSRGDADLASLTQQLIDFRNANETEFLVWVDRLKGILGNETVGELLLKIDELTEQVNAMGEMLLSGRVNARLLTNNGNYLTDSMGNVLMMDKPICMCK